MYPFEFKAWLSRWSENREPEVGIEIDLTHLVDPYDYHDAPSSVWIGGLDKEALLKLREMVDLAIQSCDGIVERYEEEKKKFEQDPDKWLEKNGWKSHIDYKKNRVWRIAYSTTRFTAEQAFEFSVGNAVKQINVTYSDVEGKEVGG